MNRLENWIGFSGPVLGWFHMFFTRRKNCFVSLDDFVSQTFVIECGVPPGSILGPMLFYLCTSNITVKLMIHNYISLLCPTVSCSLNAHLSY